jgi:hypothetical protein
MNEKPRGNASGEPTCTTPTGSNEAFTVTHGCDGRYNVMSPWGRIVASFTRDEDGDLAPRFAEHEAGVTTAALQLVACRLRVPAGSIVLAYQGAFDQLEPWSPATGAGRSVDPSLAPVGGRRR